MKYNFTWETMINYARQKDTWDGILKKDTYAFETEQDFWGLEEAETLKKYYETLAKQ